MGKTQLDPTRPTIKPGKPGRPRLRVTANDLVQIQRFAAIGLTFEEIAMMIGISLKQFQRWRERPDVYEAVQKGRAKALALVGKKLYEKATAGDMTAIIWFEKTRGKRSERVQVVNDDEAEAIQRQLAGMSTEQLQRVANGESPLEVLGGLR